MDLKGKASSQRQGLPVAKTESSLLNLVAVAYVSVRGIVLRIDTINTYAITLDGSMTQKSLES